MSNTKKVVLIVTGVLVVCLIGVSIVVGLYFAGDRDHSDYFGIFKGSRVTVNETHELNLSGVSALEVECASGSVKIMPGDEPEVTMTGALWTPEQKDEYLSITEGNGTVSIVLELDTALFSWSDIDITITLPEDCELDLDLACASADATLQNMSLGDVSMSCASGKANFSNCTGGAVDINTASGSVKIEDCVFESIHTVCQSGDIEIRNTEGAGYRTLHFGYCEGNGRIGRARYQQHFGWCNGGSLATGNRPD